ncbi:MAG: hypothetical protein IIY77_05885, partial [Lachnospiraceae bacterium]|nr:hypothetical protein [Lachnospiraceae bacterium]
MKRLTEVLKNREDNYIFPFFWQHGEEESVLREYMTAIRNANIRSVCVECRPHPDFLGEKWWHDMDIILEEARKLNMTVWILDDAHFPTGYTNGAMKDEPDEKWKQYLAVNVVTAAGPAREVCVDIASQTAYRPSPFAAQSFLMDIKPEERAFADDELVSVVIAKGLKEGIDGASARDVTGLVKDGRLMLDLEPGTWRIFVIFKTRNGGGAPGYINMISAPSVKVLLDTVYEAHYQHYGDEFGKTIQGFFSDEPQLGNISGFDDDNVVGKDGMQLPWSDELEEKLRRAYKADYGKALAFLFSSDKTGDETAEARYVYMDELTKLVASDFSCQLGKWCEDHGVRYIGHLVEDNGQHARLGSSLGHYFRGLQGQHMAGIDDIGGQVLFAGEDANRKPFFGGKGYTMDAEFFHFALGKLGSSHAALDPKKKGDTMCEIFGAYGWSEGTRLMKYLADHFLVRGVNHFVPHAFSPKAFPDPDCPPHFYAHGLNPLYKGFGELMGYMNRSAHLISGGKHKAPAAVFYHGENEWTSYEKGYMASRVPARVLTEHQIDFDFVWLDALYDNDHTLGTRTKGGKLTINGQEYQALVMPYSYYIPEKLAAWLIMASQTGLKIVFAGGYPEAVLENRRTDCEEDCGRDCEGCEENTFTENGERIVNPEGEAAREILLSVLKTRTVEADPEKLPELLDGIRDVELSADFRDLRVYHYVQDRDCYMISNESAGETFDGKVIFRHTGGLPVLYDAMENRIFTVRQDPDDKGIRLILKPYESLFVIFENPASYKVTVKEAVSYERTVLREKEIEGPFTVCYKDALDQAAGFMDAETAAELHSPALKKPDFSGWISYEASFDLDADFVKAAQDPAESAGQKKGAEEPGRQQEITLTAEEAYEAVEAFVNGTSAGVRICPPYNFDVTGLVREGRNELKLICATTLENAV